MKAYKSEGHSVDEVAERFGVSSGTAQQVTKGIAPQTQRRPKSYRNQYTAPTEKAKAAKAERINKVVLDNAPDFEYVGGYTNGQGAVQLRCKKCGSVQTRAWITVRHAHLGKALKCDACEAERWRTYREEKKANEKRMKDEAKPLVLPVRKEKQLTFKWCRECGAMFIQQCKGQVYCSKACADRMVNRRHKDKRLNKMVVVDKDIEIRELARRNGDVCALCGKAVDWNDYEVRENGVIVCGNYYPSIDHVIPLALGGKHEWKNVQLAHRRCNYLKSDNPPAASKW